MEITLKVCLAFLRVSFVLQPLIPWSLHHTILVYKPGRFGGESTRQLAQLLNFLGSGFQSVFVFKLLVVYWGIAS